MEPIQSKSKADVIEGSDMIRAHGESHSARPPQHDIGPQIEAWENFVQLTKWSTIGVIVVLVLLAIFLL